MTGSYFTSKCFGVIVYYAPGHPKPTNKRQQPFIVSLGLMPRMSVVSTTMHFSQVFIVTFLVIKHVLTDRKLVKMF